MLILPSLLLYPSLGFHLFEPDEGRYAQIPREMLDRDEWIVPYLQGEPYLDKPPMLYWLVMLSYRVLGVADWSARLPPALAVHGCILLTYFLGRRSLGERSAFWGALLLSLAPGFLSVGRLLVLDGLLAFCVALAIFAALEALRGDRLQRSWWLLSAIATGFGVLTKGPISLILLVPPLLAYGWLSQRLCRVGWWAVLGFLAVVLAIALPWYVAICCRVPEFASEFFWKHNIQRFVQPFDHLEPLWYYLPIVLFGLLPGSLLVVHWVRFLLSSQAEYSSRRTSELGFMLLAGGWCVLFFSASGCKLPTYVLPAFPFLALGLGHYLAVSDWQRSRWLHATLAASFLLLFAGHQFALPWYAEFRSPFSRPDTVAQYCDDEVPVVCYPRPCDSVAFYVGRSDFLNFRSKETPALLEFLQKQPRTVVLFTHRHSMHGLRQVLPPGQLVMTDETPLYDSARAGLDGWKYLWSKSPLGDGSRDNKQGLCYMAVIRRQ
ncbi:MAG: glycosyltransferase family 39 protein [Planctomycetia bacterium]|nr:glycosyltransferase family 39 protein [Planctomycetia bacterium]